MVTKKTMATISRVPLWRNRDAIAIAVLMSLTLIVTWHRWVFDNWLARHDLLTFFLPWLGSLGDRLRAFDIPALNPYIFSGAPFAGDPESGWMYLPAMLVFPFFEVTVAYKLMILLLLIVAGTTTYALARLIGYSVLAALFSAVAFEFGPFLFGQTDCCTVATKMTTFLPMAFLGIELALRSKTWPMRIAAWVLGGFAVSQMFAAWLGQGVVNALILVAAWVVFRTLITPPETAWSVRVRLTKLVTTGPAVLIVGLLLGAAGILPRLAANGESNNAGGTYENTPGSADGAFHTLSYAFKTLMADHQGYRGSSVWGIVLVMMVTAVFLMRRRSVIPFFAVVGLVIPALAMGAPVVSDFFYLLPLYEEIHMHSPGRVFWIYPFIAAMLAGAGIHELPRLTSRRGKWFIAFVPLALLAFAGDYMRREGNLAPGAWYWTTAILATIAVLIVAAAPLAPTRISPHGIVQGVTVALLTLAFLLPNGLDFVRTLTQEDPPPGELVMWGNDPWMQDLIGESLREDDPGGAGAFLQQQRGSQPPFRFIAYGGIYHPETILRSYPDRRLEPAIVDILQNSRAMRLRLETTQGYNPLQPLLYQEFVHALNGREQNYHFANLVNTGVNSPLLDLLNVRYVVVDRNIPESRDDHQALAETRREVYRDENVIIYESESVQPRAWMVYDVRSGRDANGLAQLASGAVDGAEVAYVQGEVPDVTAPPDGTEPRVAVSNWSPDTMTVDVSHSGEGLLVVSEVYSESWKATVDGDEVDVLQTDHALLGIPVGPGEHSINLRYEPDTLTLGLWISGLSGVGAIAVLVYAGWASLSRRRWTIPRVPTGHF